MGKKIYTDEMKVFIFENYKGKTSQEVADLVNKHFGTSFTALQMKRFRGNNKLNSGLTGHFEKGRIPHNKGKKYPGMYPNSGQYKKGRIPNSYHPVGTVNMTTDGYLKIKISDPNVWERVHLLVWREHYGPVPEGHIIVFLDGDKTNVDISNLACVNRSDIVRMNKNRYFDSDPETTKAAIGLVQLQRKVKEITNGNTL
ncbi:HNH endonuclease [Streptococcus suis]|nr:HNH endonuclease [Streptococcus suis]HEM4279106.1 HNH endonuclease [Streptococcus suis]